MRLVLTTLSLSLVAAFGAMPANASTFERDGVHYEYNLVNKSNGAVLVDGAIDDGTSFSLRVLAGHVTGTMGGMPVDFYMPNDILSARNGERPKAIAAK